MEQIVSVPQRRGRPARPSLSVGIADSAEIVRAAQELRYRVFAYEMGANLSTAIPGLDRDLFDAHCHHLVVRDEANGEVVGTYRILTPESASRIGYYSETEFDLARLDHLRPQLVEIGRSCVHPGHRSGATITLLWAGLGQFMKEHGYEYLIGCASVSMADGGHLAASLYGQLSSGPQSRMAPEEYRVFPRCPLHLAALRRDLPAEPPPLIKGYLRAGAWVCGEPAWDPDFNTADLPLLLPMARLSERYARHFFGEQGGGGTSVMNG
jgi:putative hemolysin